MTDAPQTPDLVYCSECSLMVGEQLFGSAPRADVWILLEYTGPWNNKALPQSGLPDTIKAHIDGWMSRLTNPKFQFIKQRDGESTGPYTLFIALTREQRPLLFEFELDDYADILTLDVPALVANPGGYEQYLRKSPIFTVCVNGRRDVSCARYGQPAYNELHRVAGVNGWQTTHMGGHRFAATMACLPSGVVYGRVAPDDVAEIVEHTLNGKIVAANLRGRSYYNGPIQAADYYLRGILGIDTLHGVEFIGSEMAGPSAWTVRFHTPHDQKNYAVRLESRMSDWTVLESTTDTERHAMPQFHLIDHDVERG
jgi:hypothetical protein